MGISKTEFFALTPLLLAEMLRADNWKRRERAIQFALLRREIINFSFCHPKKAVELDDLLPDWGNKRRAREPRGKRKRMTAKRRAALCEIARMGLAGLPGVKFTPGH